MNYNEPESKQMLDLAEMPAGRSVHFWLYKM